MPTKTQTTSVTSKYTEQLKLCIVEQARVPGQYGISQARDIAEIHHSGPEPSLHQPMTGKEQGLL